MNQELLRIVDSVARDKNIDKRTVLEDLEAAIRSAIRKADAKCEEVSVHIDDETGDIVAIVDGKQMSTRTLGRIAAQTAKQVLIQRIREAERGSIFEEYVQRKGQIITGKTLRWEGGSLVVDLGRTEAYLPRGEQIPGESHAADERLRAMVLDVREQPSQVKIILSRTHPDFIRALFELEVPEVAEGIIELRMLAREAGYRTKVAVNSLESKVDAVGACVGIRGSRIRNIVDELGGEKIDIVRWNDSSKILIANALKPAEVAEVALCFELGRAIVVVVEEQLSLAIGKRGQNVRLAARLTGWDIDILTPAEFGSGLDTLEKALREVEGVDSTVVDQIIAMGMVTVMDLEEVGPGPLTKELGLSEATAQLVVARAAQEAKDVAARAVQAAEDAKKQAELDKAAAAAEAEQAAAAAAEEAEPGEGVEGEQAPAADEADAIEDVETEQVAAAAEEAEPTEGVEGEQAPAADEADAIEDVETEQVAAAADEAEPGEGVEGEQAPAAAEEAATDEAVEINPTDVAAVVDVVETDQIDADAETSDPAETPQDQPDGDTDAKALDVS